MGGVFEELLGRERKSGLTRAGKRGPATPGKKEGTSNAAA